MNSSRRPTVKTTPTLSSYSFEYNNTHYDVEFYEIQDNQIPNLPWKQVYAVGNINQKVPLVTYAHAKATLPGGGVKPGESVEEALHREIREELNMKVLSWYPLGYQKNISQYGDVDYQLRVYAVLEKIGEFEKDPDGSVIGHVLVDIHDMNTQMQWGEVGDWLVRRVADEYADNTTKK